VIVTSDHGELFGEHGLFIHGNCLYRRVLQVPLLISYPSGLPSDIRVSNAVSLRDIPATVLDLIGAEENQPFPGSSLARYWRPGTKVEPSSEVVLSELAGPARIPADQGRSPVSEGPMKALVINGKQYIRNYGNGSEELYDFACDPEELHDLSQVAKSQEDLKGFRRFLEEILSSSNH
jgi:arylsulfatase A-like enzyme